MRVFTYLIALYVLFLGGCNNIEDAPQSKRNTFIHLYEGPDGYTASDMIQVDDGFLILGNVVKSAGDVRTVLIHTDARGNLIDSVRNYPDGSGNVVRSYSNGSGFTGYLIIGDSIHFDDQADQVGNIDIYSARILSIDQNLNMIKSLTFSDNSSNVVKTDIRGNSLAIKKDVNGDDAGIIFLITYEQAGSTQKPWVISFDNNNQLEWEYQFSSLSRDYVNGKSVHHSEGHVIWANSLLRQQGSLNEKYATVTSLEDYLSTDKYSLYGESDNKSISANDIQQAKDIAFGFGVVGTVSNTDGTNQNIFFAPTNKLGELILQDTLFIDASLGETRSYTSETEESGVTLCSTSDGGYVLAGTLQSTPDIGNGEGDIYLVKINAFGDIVWQKIIGGAGDEVVSTIIETSDRGLALCGTNTIGGYPSIFFIKTDSNGELKN